MVMLNNFQNRNIKLPPPICKGHLSIEEALLLRRSVRTYRDSPINLQDLSQILWSAQGITEKNYKFRTCPSAGATFPLEIYVSAYKVHDLDIGIYKYIPENHELNLHLKGDKREDLYIACLRQEWIRKAPVIIIISANYYKTTARYGERGIRYIFMEAGHCAQNIYLQCVSLNLGTVAVGAFNDEDVKRIINLPKNEFPLYLLPIGKI